MTDLNDRSTHVSLPSSADLASIGTGYHQNPAASMSLRADAYTSPTWFAHEQQAILQAQEAQRAQKQAADAAAKAEERKAWLSAWSSWSPVHS